MLATGTGLLWDTVLISGIAGFRRVSRQWIDLTGASRRPELIQVKSAFGKVSMTVHDLLTSRPARSAGRWN